MEKEERLLEVKNMVKFFGQNEILKGIDLSVYRGDVISILGRSGSGKSTFLRCINLLEEPTSGDILFHGESILDPDYNINEYRSDVGMVFQQFNLFQNKTVLENCMIGQEKVLHRPKNEAREKAMHSLDLVGMAAYANARPAQISGGQMQRVGIARSLSMDPEIILFDEPTSALDPETVDSVLAVMTDLVKAGMTMLVVTHEMNFAKDVSSRVCFVDKGQIIVDEDPEEFFNHPKDPSQVDFLARFSKEHTLES